jgi:hypothetical protein
MEILSASPKTLLLYGPEVHKLHLEFEVAERVDVLTFSADLVEHDQIFFSADGVAATPITWGTAHSNTMTALAAAIANLDSIDTATVSGRTIIITPVDNAVLTYNVSVARLLDGIGTAVGTVANTQGAVYPGQPVVLVGSGEKVKPLAAGVGFLNAIGFSLHKGLAGELITVVMKGHAVIAAESGEASLIPGPVKVLGFDTATLRVKYGVTSTDTDVAGWALDAGNDGDDIRVVVSA